MSKEFNQGGERLQTTNQNDCSDRLVDETSSTENPQLAAKIDELVGKGIDVHVRIVSDITDDGYSELTDYIEAVDSKCGWNAQNELIFSVSDNPRKYDFFKDGTVENVIARGNNERVLLDRTVDELKDTSTSYQEDALAALELIDTMLETPGASPEPVPEIVTPQIEQPEKTNPVDVPLKEIAVISTGLVGIVGAAAIIASRKNYNRAVKSQSQEIADTQVAAMEASENAMLELQLTAETDAIELRNLFAELNELQGLMPALQSHYKTTLQGGRRIVRRADSVESAMHSVATTESRKVSMRELLSELSETTQKVRQQTEELERDKQAIEKEHQAYLDQIETLRRYSDELTTRGYDSSYFNGRVMYHAQKASDVAELRKTYHFQRPRDILQEQQPALQRLIVAAEQFSEVEASVNSAADNLLAVRPDALKEEKQQIFQELRSLTETYDKSCWSDVADDSEDLKSLFDEKALLEKRIKQGKNTKDVAELFALQNAVTKLRNINDEISHVATAIKERTAQLSQLAQELPRTIRDLDGATIGLNSYIDSFDELELSDETRREATELRTAYNGLRMELTDNRKPKYLEIDKSQKQMFATVERLRSKARAEQDEFRRVEQEYRVLNTRAQSSVRNAQSYLASNRHKINASTSSRISSLRMYDDTPRSRDDYFTSLVVLQSLINDAERARSSAQNDVASYDTPSYTSSSYSSSSGSHSGGGFDFGGSSGGDSGGSHSGGDY